VILEYYQEKNTCSKSKVDRKHTTHSGTNKKKTKFKRF